ncbi:XRE family transcriptional regulator [Streptomyces sp. ICBB 8177]|uniref:helix-turn-helix domain-containing protein n=1 Tax=Streptomyces sp. ICBB 8177 TaxID=563922 RepID=UPI000D677D73|nr:XRE family transcriptional regulator [Streptomyces sp. ICBB 8177]PWI42775.1 XRE family transcriptional regulator [Streptomyces sp. ICBB 8177]
METPAVRPDPSTDAVLAEVGPRLRRIRQRRGATLAALSEATGISKSTLSRLEAGRRRPSLELLLPIARAHQIPLDELIGTGGVGDPRIRPVARTVEGMTIAPLTRRPGAPQAYKMVIPPQGGPPEPRTHEGYEWVYVLSGRLRLVLAEHDLVLRPGEAAEFDTRVPHAFTSAGEGPVEVLSIFGSQGERIHFRARPKTS